MKIGHLFLDESELHYHYMRSPGPGGQNVNKVATGVLLRFNVLQSSSLPQAVRERLFLIAGNKINSQGELLIKATRYRTQMQNKMDARQRLKILIQQAATPPKKRKPTKMSFATKLNRLHKKKLHSNIKALRNRKFESD